MSAALTLSLRFQTRVMSDSDTESGEGSDWPRQGHREAAAESNTLTSCMSRSTEAGTR